VPGDSRSRGNPSDLALDALEQALYDRPVGESERLVQHSDRGMQYLSIRYTERAPVREPRNEPRDLGR